MTGDPKCVICHGDGVVTVEAIDVNGKSVNRDEPCSCVEHYERKRSSSGGGLKGLDDTLKALMAASLAKQERLVAHQASCTARPCRECERFVCACGQPFDGAQNTQCSACARAQAEAKALKAVRGLFPARFHSACGADLATLCARIQGSEELVRRGVENPPSKDLLFVGNSGAGKTTLAVAMLDAWVRKDPARRGGARFVSSFALAMARQRHPLGHGEAPEVAAAIAAPMLLLDDVGTEPDVRGGVVSEVIFMRHNEDRPTWITTGFDEDALAQRYGSQIIRRIIEHGRTVFLGARA